MRPTLRHVSFEVRAGETIGLVGPSGGGKSALVNLLLRSYEREQRAHPDRRRHDPDSREALASTMQSAGFVLDVAATLGIEEDYEVRIWRARTRHGLRTLQRRLDD